MDDGLPLVGVIGAGTMGAGIAQVAAIAGHRVLLADAVDGAAARAIDRIRERVKAQVARGRLDADPGALDLAPATISPSSAPGLAGAGVVIEAVVEDLAVKRRLFGELEQVVPADCLLASNSSSLTPTAMAAGLAHPERLVGLHFFNPVPAMRLVEVISGLATATAAADRAEALARAWGKTVVRSAATPGFIVNRIARPYYAEAWRLLEEHAAAAEVIDALLTGAGGFRMGPFALMDLIGHDVNESVTRSVWAAFGNDPRFAPSLAQRSLVEAGWLGRKTGRGCYDYADGAAPPVPAPAAPRQAPAFVISHGQSELGQLLARSGVSVQQAGAEGQEGDRGQVELPGGPVIVRCVGATASALAATEGRPVIVVDRTLDDATATAIAVAASADCPADALDLAVGLLQAAGLNVFVIDDVPGLIVTRTVAMLANLAADAVAGRVASAADIDTAMRLGVNYPQGPLAWAGQWGLPTVLAALDELENWYRDGHYRPSPLLRRAAVTNGSLTAVPGAETPVTPVIRLCQHGRMDQAQAQAFAEQWVRDWNAHDVEALLAHFADDVVFTSPVAIRVLGGDGVVRGKEALRTYWSEGIRLIPGLRFEVLAVYVGVSTVVINYRNQAGGLVSEVLTFDGALVREGHGTYLTSAV